MSERPSGEQYVQPGPIWQQEKFKDFFINRKIKEEDKILVERLAEFPNKYFLEYHNFFHMKDIIFNIVVIKLQYW